MKNKLFDKKIFKDSCIFTIKSMLFVLVCIVLPGIVAHLFLNKFKIPTIIFLTIYEGILVFLAYYYSEMKYQKSLKEKEVLENS